MDVGASQVQVGSFSALVMQCPCRGYSTTELREGSVAGYKVRGYWCTADRSTLLITVLALREFLAADSQYDWDVSCVYFERSADSYPRSCTG